MAEDARYAASVREKARSVQRLLGQRLQARKRDLDNAMSEFEKASTDDLRSYHAALRGMGIRNKRDAEAMGVRWTPKKGGYHVKFIPYWDF